MMEFDGNKEETSRTETPAAQSESLPYSVELWRAADTVERVLGRAANTILARAIFNAAISEHPGRRITLRLGEEIVQESADGSPPAARS